MAIKGVISDLETKRDKLGNDQVNKAVAKAREEIQKLENKIEKME